MSLDCVQCSQNGPYFAYRQRSMKSQARTISRPISLLVAIVFALAASTSSASWQCMDGKFCPAGCTMMRAQHSASATRKGATCSACPAEATAIVVDHGAPGCTTPRCVFRSGVRPDVSLSGGTTVPFASPALLPVVGAPAPSIPSAAVRSADLGFFPQHFLRSPSGRSPPSVLS